MLKVSKDNTMRLLAVFMVLLFSVIACAPSSFNTSEKATFTTTRTLQAAKELRVTALKTIGGMYIAGTLTDPVFKKDVIRVGDLLQEAINFTSEALLIYQGAATSENKATLAGKVLLYQQVYGEFSDLVMPYVLEHMVK